MAKHPSQVYLAVHDLRAVVRIAEGRKESPTAAIFDSRTLQSTSEKGSKAHLAVDTLGHLLALCVAAADEQDRAQVSELAKRVQAETGEIAFVDQRYDEVERSFRLDVAISPLGSLL
jgi:hypothetical protein